MIGLSNVSYLGRPAAGPGSEIVFLSGFEGADTSTTLTDESTYARAVTANNGAQIRTDQFKFGSSSLKLDGSNDYASLADNADFEFGTGSWTVECFLRFSSLGSFGCGVISKGTTSGSIRSWLVDYKRSGTLEWKVRTSSNGSSYDNTLTAADTLVVNTWYHLCVEYDLPSTKLRIYRDGVMKGSLTATLNLFNHTSTLNIGGDPVDSTFAGWLDEVRISKGVAQYNSDSGFTVPAAAYPR